jgi:hypothetical protein
MTDAYLPERSRHGQRYLRLLGLGGGLRPREPRFNRFIQRRGASDRNQPVFGLFAGGGYAFGITESDQTRIPKSVYEWVCITCRVVNLDRA